MPGSRFLAPRRQWSGCPARTTFPRLLRFLGATTVAWIGGSRLVNMSPIALTPQSTYIALRSPTRRRPATALYQGRSPPIPELVRSNFGRCLGWEDCPAPSDLRRPILKSLNVRGLPPRMLQRDASGGHQRPQTVVHGDPLVALGGTIGERFELRCVGLLEGVGNGPSVDQRVGGDLPAGTV